MSQTTPEGRLSRREARGIRREFKRTVRQGTKSMKAAYQLARKDVDRMSPRLREEIGASGLTSAHLTAMAQRALTGVHDQNDRADLRTLAYTAQGQYQGPSQEPTSLVGRLTEAASGWRDYRRGTKMLKAAYAQAAKDVKTMDPVVRSQIGHSRMSRGDLAYLAKNNFIGAATGSDRFEVSPGVSAEQADRFAEAAPEISPQQAPQVESQQRLDALRAEIQQLRAQIGQLEAEVARLEAAEQQQAVQGPEQAAAGPEAQQPTVQQPAVQQPAVQPTVQQPAAQPAVQQPAVQQAAVQQPAAAAPGVQQPEVADPNKTAEWNAVPTGQQATAQQQLGGQQESPAAQPGAQQPEATQPGVQESGTAQPGVPQPVFRAEGQQPQQEGGRVPAAQQSPRGSQQAVFQSAGNQPTTQPGQPQRPAAGAPTFQAAGEQLPQSPGQHGDSALHSYDSALSGVAPPKGATTAEAKKTAQSDPNKNQHSTGQSANRNTKGPDGRS
ncbi:hypothetical protein HPO96_28365 [Kribbella sandramycini]|uniref:Uncharacterized protein n=1 Tax=Kribbella sandramycini TaxID=60450 RepID=A0A7Y4L4E6_9ACTN|nr:hypothetical protein [Kribbella sandramycini]MBB6571519.1 hypothetical protein [Kribbella sandramycini]NOL44168.1 hypothetical protein [Kribbella sandramycini]